MMQTRADILRKLAADINSERTISIDRYREEGCATRFDWITSLAEQHGLKLSTVIMLACDVLGPDEDFDGLVTACADAEGSVGL